MNVVNWLCLFFPSQYSWILIALYLNELDLFSFLATVQADVVFFAI